MSVKLELQEIGACNAEYENLSCNMLNYVLGVFAQGLTK